MSVGHSRSASSGGSAASALRQLLGARFPPAARAADDALATGIAAVDEAGGLPRPGLTELVCSTPSCGSQLFVGQLLQVTRAQNLRVALVDRADCFDPASWPAPLLEHLVWVRARSATEAFNAADLLARDANLALVMLDLRSTTLTELRRIPASSWYRLQRAIEPTLLAALILTPVSLVPSARLRLELGQTHTLSHLSAARPFLSAALAPGFLRQRLPTAVTG